jgi:hypothetical protein
MEYVYIHTNILAIMSHKYLRSQFPSGWIRGYSPPSSLWFIHVAGSEYRDINLK